MALRQQTPPSSLWLAQSVVLGVSCGVVGYFLAQEDGTKPRLSQAFQKVKRAFFNKNLWEATVPWWLVLACPSPWYPLALWFIVSTQQEKDNDEDENEEENHADPFSEDSARPVTRTRTAETRSDSLSLISTQNDAPEKPKRYLEMLVHNVSHTDLVLSVNAPPATEEEDVYCLCRPRFSAFDLYCRRILENLSGNEEVISFPRYERSESSPRYTIVSPKPARKGRLNTGLALDSNGDSLKITTEELPNLRFRGRDAHRIEPYYQEDDELPSDLKLSHAFFPLLATLLPRWKRELTKKYSNRDVPLKKVVVLVSGVGTPRNWTHSIKGNSTQACAHLMERFIHVLFPDVTVVRIHSQTNIFRYDENIAFVKQELMPCIDAYRDAHARGLPYPDEAAYLSSYNQTTPFSPDWKQSFNVTLSFADGSHARTHAIQTSLRPYRPTYFHLWQLKTFWHDTKIVQDDLEVHSFEDMETVPAVDGTLAQDDVKLVVEEMKEFRNDFLESLQKDNDIAQFWLRKSRKPVLAVLLVSNHKQNGKPLLYRGTNMEVSMPTGSLCAERNVIGTALASNPGLKREDLKMVAVLAVPLELVQQQQQQQQEVVRPPHMPRSTSLASYSSVQEEDEETDWVIPADGIPVEKLSVEEVVPVYHVSEQQAEVFTPRSTPPGTPVRRITLYSQAQEVNIQGDKVKPTMGLGRSSKVKKTVLVHSAEVRWLFFFVVMFRSIARSHMSFYSHYCLGSQSSSPLRRL